MLEVGRWLDQLEVRNGTDVTAVLDSIESFAYVVGLQLSPGNHNEFGLEVYLPQSDVNQAHERRLFERLNEMGITILLVEQNVRQALEIADRAYLLEAGRLIEAGPARDLLTSERVTAAYLGG